MRKAQRRSFALTICVALLVFSAWGVMIVQWRDCKHDGGKYVRGLVWMECVKP